MIIIFETEWLVQLNGILRNIPEKLGKVLNVRVKLRHAQIFRFSKNHLILRMVIVA